MQLVQYAKNFLMRFIANFSTFFVDSLNIFDYHLQPGNQMCVVDL